jgi:hypothetical protein
MSGRQMPGNVMPMPMPMALDFTLASADVAVWGSVQMPLTRASAQPCPVATADTARERSARTR